MIYIVPLSVFESGIWKDNPNRYIMVRMLQLMCAPSRGRLILVVTSPVQRSRIQHLAKAKCPKGLSFILARCPHARLQRARATAGPTNIIEGADSHLGLVPAEFDVVSV